MVDNTGQGGSATIATDDVTTLNGAASSGVHVQRVKVGFGSDNTFRDADASNGVPVRPQTAATGTLTSVAGTVTNSTTILAANSNRLDAMVYNDGAAILYLSLGATATTTTHTVQIPGNGFWELPNGVVYTGIITGVWSSATGSARVTELT